MAQGLFPALYRARYVPVVVAGNWGFSVLDKLEGRFAAFGDGEDSRVIRIAKEFSDGTQDPEQYLWEPVGRHHVNSL